MPEFDACFATMRRRHDDIDRVQVTNEALEELVLETGLGREKVHRIPIGIDVERSRRRHRSPGGRAARPQLLGGHAFVLGSFQKDVGGATAASRS
jgi:hypothetical protein